MKAGQTAPKFTQPVRQIVTMLLIVGLVTAGAWLAFARIAPVFLSNVWLNGLIFAVFLVGVVACFLQVLQLISSVGWIEGFAGGRSGAEIARPPGLLVPLAALLRGRGARSQLSASSTRSILESVATRIEEARDITRYIVNLLIFLGLLGTFYGLATTVPAVVETIRSLAPANDEGSVAVFDRLMTGLEAQLGGMGTAFSSSLLGLAGSLVVGLLELFAGHGQNRFYRELEEWLSSITRLGVAGSESEGGSDSQSAAILSQFAETMVDQMEQLQELFTRSDVARSALEARFDTLAQAVERLAGQIEIEAGTAIVLARIADGQDRLAEGVLRMAEGQDRTLAAQDRLVQGQDRLAAGLLGTATEAAPDAEARMRLRSIDVQLLRILEEMAVGRQESLADLRSDLAQLTRAVRQLGANVPTPPEGGRRRV